MVEGRISFLQIAQLWCASKDAMVSRLEPMTATMGMWAVAHLAALHFAVALRRAGVVGSQGARGAVLGLFLRQLRSNRPPMLLRRRHALAAEGVLQQLHCCWPVLCRRPQTPAIRQRAVFRAFRSWATVVASAWAVLGCWRHLLQLCCCQPGCAHRSRHRHPSQDRWGGTLLITKRRNTI